MGINMSLIVKQTEEILKSKIIDAIAAATASGELPQAEMPAFIIEKPADKKKTDPRKKHSLKKLIAKKEAMRQKIKALRKKK